MTAPMRTRTVRTAAPTNPLRAKALDYYRSNRLSIWWLTGATNTHPADEIHAHILPAPGDPTGMSVRVPVGLKNGRWYCNEHPGANACSHRLAVQMATGHESTEGRWMA